MVHFFLFFLQFVRTSKKVGTIILVKHFYIFVASNSSIKCLYEVLNVGYFNKHSSTWHTGKHYSITFDFNSTSLDNNMWRVVLLLVYTQEESAIFCSPGLPCILRHFTNLNKRFLTEAMQLVIQYPELLTSFKVALLPP